MLCSTPIDYLCIHVGVAVARVRMTSVTTEAYTAALQDIFECCNEDNSTNIFDCLKGVVVDWSTAQIQGLKAAVGEGRAEQLLRGCQVRDLVHTKASLYTLMHH